MEYRVEVVLDEGGLQGLGASWTGLLQRSQIGSMFTSFPWNLAWWHSFGESYQPYVLVARDSTGEVRGIAPLMRRHAGTVRKLEFIGTGLSDTGDFLLDADHAEPAARASLAYLQVHCREWDIVDLDEVPAYSPLVKWLGARELTGMRLIQVPRNNCPFIELPATWEDYTHALHRKARQQLEAFSRRVIEETGAHFRMVTEEAEVPDAVARFYKLHLARWATKEDELSHEHLEPGFVPFLEEVCRRAAEHGYLRLAELCVGDEPIASWISFQVNGRLNGYMTGFDPAWSKQRPGKILHGFVVRQALAEGAHELDFGRGDEPYKYEMGAINRKNCRFVIANDTSRSAVMFRLTALRMHASTLVHRISAGGVTPPT